MKGSTAALVRRLEAEAPPRVIAELSVRACEQDSAALDALVRYANEGKFIGVRDSVVSQLASVATPQAAFLEANFREWLRPTSREGQRFWAVLGLINTLGTAAFPELVALASDESSPTDIRAHAIKLMATQSGQTFDAGKPSDPGHWRAEDLDVSRLHEWAASGYARGAGHVVPGVDPALHSPTTRIERAASHLDELLRKRRHARFDPANPSDMLVPASPIRLEAIKSLYELPSNYLEFLRRFSPLNVSVESRRFINFLQLYGVEDLVAGQLGYSINGQTSERIEDWPTTMIVVGNDGGDPYTLDLWRASESDAPVCTAPHGRGSWRFSDVAPSFIDFIEQLR